MSHFTVLVVGEDPDKQLDPFWELDLHQDDAKKDYRAELNIEILNDELVKQFQLFKIEHSKSLNNRITELGKRIENRDFEIPSYRKDETIESMIENAKKQILSCMNDLANLDNDYPNAESWVQEYHSYSLGNDKDGNYGWGYYRNPNAKWDWYQIGGRWSGFFKLKPNTSGKLGEKSFMVEGDIPTGYADQARKGDIDWEGMCKEGYEHAEKDWDKAHNLEANDEGRYFTYGIKKDDTKESFCKRCSSPCTFAVLKDGVWYERGEMGWWACVSNEKEESEWEEEFNKLIENLPDDTLLTVVDCHI